MTPIEVATKTKAPRLIVLGASAGGLRAVSTLLEELPAPFPWPLVLCLHILDRTHLDFAAAFRRQESWVIKEAEEKEMPVPGTLYLAPPGYHLLLERDGTFSLSNEAPENWARPSIDVLFESAAIAYGPQLLGILLTGANQDGARGLHKIGELGGLTIVQDPETAEISTMPQAAIKLGPIHHILSLTQISQLLERLSATEGT